MASKGRTPPAKDLPVEYCDYCQQPLGLTADGKAPVPGIGQFVLCERCRSLDVVLRKAAKRITAGIPPPLRWIKQRYTKDELWTLLNYENMRAETAVNRMAAIQAQPAQQPRKPKGQTGLTKAILAEYDKGARTKDLARLYMTLKHPEKVDPEQARTNVRQLIKRTNKAKRENKTGDK